MDSERIHIRKVSSKRVFYATYTDGETFCGPVRIQPDSVIKLIAAGRLDSSALSPDYEVVFDTPFAAFAAKDRDSLELTAIPSDMNPGDSDPLHSSFGDDDGSGLFDGLMATAEDYDPDKNGLLIDSIAQKLRLVWPSEIGFYAWVYNHEDDSIGVSYCLSKDDPGEKQFEMVFQRNVFFNLSVNALREKMYQKMSPSETDSNQAMEPDDPEYDAYLRKIGEAWQTGPFRWRRLKDGFIQITYSVAGEALEANFHIAEHEFDDISVQYLEDLLKGQMLDIRNAETLREIKNRLEDAWRQRGTIISVVRGGPCEGWVLVTYRETGQTSDEELAIDEKRLLSMDKTSLKSELIENTIPF